MAGSPIPKRTEPTESMTGEELRADEFNRVLIGVVIGCGTFAFSASRGSVDSVDTPLSQRRNTP